MIHNNTPVNVYPRIIPADTITTTDGNVTTYKGTLYLAIFDAATNLPANGNGINIVIQDVSNGVPSPPRTATVIGTEQKVYAGTILETNNFTGDVTYSHIVNIVSWEGLTLEDPPASTAICDAVISSVNIDKKESAPGAVDGQITIIAQSSQLPITYSLDGSTFQSSATFSGLIGGAYTAYISDANGCTAIQSFTLDTVQNLLVSDPSVNLGQGNVSRWNAAFNPVVFAYQRKDFEVTNVIADGNGNMIVNVNANVISLKENDLIYLNAGAYKGVYKVKSASFNQIFINSPATATGTNAGFVNINKLRPYYRVNTNITFFNWDTNRFETVTSVNRPDQSGLVRTDISNFLQNLLRAKDDSNYNVINYRDANLSASYTISYAEIWDGIEQDHAPVYLNIADPYYVVYAAKQLGDAYGGNLAAYVPFPTVNSQSKLARWVTDFAEPAYSNHYPFDIGFIYSEAIAGLNIYCEITLLDINRQPITGSTQTSSLLNEDSSFLISQDGSKLVIADASASIFPIAEHIALNRLLINQTFPDNACYFTLALKYDDANAVTHTISQTQTIRIDGMVDDQSVYLRWIGLSGCWNYYRFVYNQEVSLDVQNAVIIKNFVSDWANQQGIEEVISKSAGQKMKVMAEDLPVADIKGLQSIKYSPKVQMLVGRNPIKWQTVVINTATFAEYETRNGQAPFSVTFNLPAINVQGQ